MRESLSLYINVMDNSVQENSILQYLINHIFIPPKLPQEEDYSEEAERRLCQHVYQAGLDYDALRVPDQESRWPRFLKTLQMIHECHSSGQFSLDAIRDTMAAMEQGGK
jgi:hypothetical protein